MAEGSLGSSQSRTVERSVLVAGQFTINLAKVLVQSGSFSPEHPAWAPLATDLYRQFKEITSRASEITYTLSSTVEERGILLEGLSPEPIELGKVVSSIESEHFLSKIDDFFIRARIAALTLKRSLTQDSFNVFLELLSRWQERLKGVRPEEAASLLQREITEAGIFGVTVVGIDEVPGQSRALPWPVRLVLGRLRADLARLARASSFRKDALTTMKEQAVFEIVSEIRRLEMLSHLLLNADLACEGNAEVDVKDVERAMVTALPREALVPVLASIVEGVEALRRSKEKEVAGRKRVEFLEVSERVGRLVALRLARENPPDASEVLLRAYQNRFIELEALPETLRKTVKARELCDRFLQNWKAYLEDFERCTDPKTYLKYLNVFAVIIPELISRRASGPLSRIFEILDSHLKDKAPPFVGRSRFIGEALQVIERAKCLEDLVELAVSTPKEERQGLEVGVSLFGAQAVPYLVEVIGSEDVSRRAAGISMLVRTGPSGVPAIIAELESHRHPWYTVRNLIGVLGELKARQAVSVLQRFVHHPHPKVREELVQALAKILGDEGERILLSFLQDESQAVVRRAIHFLGEQRCIAGPFLRTIYESVRLRSRNEDEPDLALQSACLTALQNYEFHLMPETPDLEGALMEVVKPPRIKTKLPGSLGVRPKPLEVQILAIKALGAIGTGRSLSVLMDLVGSKNEEVTKAAAEAAERIRSRQTSLVTKTPLKF